MACQSIAIRRREPTDAVHFELQLRDGIVGNGIRIARCRMANHRRKTGRLEGALDALQHSTTIGRFHVRLLIHGVSFDKNPLT